MIFYVFLEQGTKLRSYLIYLLYGVIYNRCKKPWYLVCKVIFKYIYICPIFLSCITTTIKKQLNKWLQNIKQKIAHIYII